MSKKLKENTNVRSNITFNSISGGKTSAYILANYTADFNIFALVRTSDRKCQFPDKKLRQYVSDKIGTEFIGTLEDDIIIYTIIDLEQYTGKKIDWVTGEPFDDIITGTKNQILPSALRRFCTSSLKITPIFEFWLKNVGIENPITTNIGIRADEMERAKRIQDKTNKDGYLMNKYIVGKRGSRNKWNNVPWQKPNFPLIKDNIYKDNIEKYWADKNVRFAWMNNCVGCFHKQPVLINKMSKLHPNKLEWFASKERNRKYEWDKWRVDGITYDEMINYNYQMELFEDDFNSCDSGHCGL